MADNILASDRIRSKVDSLKVQYSYAMAKYCCLKEGTENPTENEIKEKGEFVKDDCCVTLFANA